MAISPRRLTTIALPLLALILGAACGPASAATTHAAKKPRLVVQSPSTAPAAPGIVAVRATLKASRKDKIRRVRFYVGKKRVTDDRKYPFEISRGVKFDTRTLPLAASLLTLTAKYEQKNHRGKITKRTLRKRLRLSLITPPVDPPSCSPDGYALALNEDFNGSALNTDVWNTGRYDTRNHIDADDPAPFTRPYNGDEGAAYGPDNVTQQDGALNLEVLNTPAPRSPEGLTQSTGMVNTMNKFAFKYGYIETRVMVPDCAGCWPAFWIVPADGSWPPEIDIIEYMNFPVYHPRYPHTVFHYSIDSPQDDTQGFEHQVRQPEGKPEEWQQWLVTRPAGWDADMVGQWHTYGLLWTPDRAEVCIDGKLGATVRGASKLPQQSMYLIYQMAIGLPEVGIPPEHSAMKIDYLRVYTNES